MELCPPLFPVPVTGFSSNELAKDADSSVSDTVTGNRNSRGLLQALSPRKAVMSSRLHTDGDTLPLALFIPGGVTSYFV